MRTRFLIVLAFIFFFFPQTVCASSKTAYDEYLIDFDSYRAKLNEFKVAKSEYLKFKTLTSQQTALTKTKDMVVQRAKLLRSYLAFINEKLNENTGIDPTNKSLYQSLIQSEVTFLNNHTSLVSAIGSLEDAERVSSQLSSHYTLLLANIYQTIVGIKMGEMALLEKEFDQTYTKTSEMINTKRSNFPIEKQSIMDRWLLQIQNKRDLYKQKVDEINTTSSSLKSTSSNTITTTYQTIQKNMSEARQYLAEGASYLKELTDTMQYGE